MIYEWKSGNYIELRNLFEEYQFARSIILPALVKDRGVLYVDNLVRPDVARLFIGGINFFAGDCSNIVAREMVENVKSGEFLTGSTNGWNNLFQEIWTNRLGTRVRTKMSTESLDIAYLRSLMNKLGNEFKLERADLKTIRSLDKRHNMHILLFFGSSKEFIENGIAFCIKHEERVVSMASTFAPFIDEFEVQVTTTEDTRYRRKGLATIVSAALIIYALEHGLVPHWDAANEASVELALKLGYTNPTKWDSYFVKSIPTMADD